jgi:hypothetical protein
MSSKRTPGQRGEKASDKPEKEEEAGAGRRASCDVERSLYDVISTSKKLVGHFDVKQLVERVVMAKIHPALQCLILVREREKWS